MKHPLFSWGTEKKQTMAKSMKVLDVNCAYGNFMFTKYNAQGNFFLERLSKFLVHFLDFSFQM